MKKIIFITITVAALLLQSACANSTAKKAVEESKMSMASGDYNAALNYLQLASEEGNTSDDIEEVKSILANYLKAKEEFDKINMDGASEALDAIPASYTNYSIAKDIDSLKEQVSQKKSVMGDVDSQIEAVKKYIANGDYTSAESNITDLYSKDITDYQRKQIDELKQTLDSANSKIKEAEDNAVQASANTNVVATYYVVNCAESITLRSKPSTSAAEITQVPLGQAVGYIENAGNGFYKINYDGSVGYALASYLSDVKPSSSSRRTARVVNCDQSITLRKTPSTTGEELRQIPLGAYVSYISTAENGFYCIEYGGQRGYALQSYLQLQ